LLYHSTFPDRFGSIEDARAFCRDFFGWYNDEHRHSGIGLMTPKAVHYGQAECLTAQRKAVLSDAYSLNPERFVSGLPKPHQVPQAAWINKPKPPSGVINTNKLDRCG
jgi:putative transposase